jgi:hypothetical protein
MSSKVSITRTIRVCNHLFHFAPIVELIVIAGLLFAGSVRS